jgi:hypothetical protein
MTRDHRSESTQLPPLGGPITERGTSDPPPPKRTRRTKRDQIPTKHTRGSSRRITGAPGKAQADDRFPSRDKPIGRQPKLTAEVRQKICQAVAIGVPFNRACWLAGIDDDTGREWLARGQGRDKDRPREPRYAAFAGAIEKARARDIAARVARVTQAGRGGAVVQRRTVTRPDGSSIVEERFSEPQWTADMTMLERRYPEEFGRRVALEHGGGVGVIDFAAVVTEARRRADARLAAAKAMVASTTTVPPLPPPAEHLETQEEMLIRSSTIGKVIPLHRTEGPVEGQPPLATAPSTASPPEAATCGDAGPPTAGQDTEFESVQERGGREMKEGSGLRLPGSRAVTGLSVWPPQPTTSP